MFVGTHLGMFMPALRPDHIRCIADGDPELQVRARRRVDLDRLRKFMQARGLALGPTIALPNTDYQFRAYCTRAVWGQALAALAEDIDYTKFKDTPAAKHRDAALTSAYGRMWTALLDAFPIGSVYDPRRGRGRGKGAGPRQSSLFSEKKNWWEDA